MLKLQTKVQAGFTIIELLIVIAIIGILATLVLTNFQGAQAKGRDTVRKNDINSVYQKLEEYHQENGGYPDGELTTAVFPGIDAGALEDADGDGFDTTGGFITATTASNPDPDDDTQYYYIAYGCETAGAQTTVDGTCDHYILATFLEREDDYIKASLN